MSEVPGLSPLARKYGEYWIPPKLRDSDEAIAFGIESKGIGAGNGGGFAEVVTRIGESGTEVAGIGFDEDARAGLVDFAADPVVRDDRLVDLRRTTIVELKI